MHEEIGYRFHLEGPRCRTISLIFDSDGSYSVVVATLHTRWCPGKSHRPGQAACHGNGLRCDLLYQATFAALNSQGDLSGDRHTSVVGKADLEGALFPGEDRFRCCQARDLTTQHRDVSRIAAHDSPLAPEGDLHTVGAVIQRPAPGQRQHVRAAGGHGEGIGGRGVHHLALISDGEGGSERRGDVSHILDASRGADRVPRPVLGLVCGKLGHCHGQGRLVDDLHLEVSVESGLIAGGVVLDGEHCE